MARLFDGVSDTAKATFDDTTPPLNEISAVGAWLWRDNIADTGCIFEFGRDTGTGFDVFSNQFAVNQDLVRWFSGANSWADSYPAPSSNAWHHYLWVMRDMGPNNVWIDGVAQTLTDQGHVATVAINAVDLFTFMYRNTAGVASRFTAGRICEIGYWVGLPTPSDQHALALYQGVPPPYVLNDSLVGYWPMLGDASPEPNYTQGQENATLGGTSVVNHPAVRSLALGANTALGPN